MQRGSIQTLRVTLDLFYEVAHPLTAHTISSGELGHCLAVAITRVQRLVALGEVPNGYAALVSST